jgi:ferrous iron transport protein A
MKIREMEIGKSARIIGYHKGDRQYRQKLLGMGLTKGEILTIKRVAPLGDPIEVMIKGYNMTLRKIEADMLIVEEV